MLDRAACVRAAVLVCIVGPPALMYSLSAGGDSFSAFRAVAGPQPFIQGIGFAARQVHRSLPA